MNKLLKPIKEYLHKWLNSYGETNYYFKDIDSGLKGKIKKHIYGIPILIVVGILLSVFASDITILLAGLLIAVIDSFYVLLQIKDIYSGKIQKITGVFFDSNENNELEDYDDNKMNRLWKKHKRYFIRIMLPNKTIVKVYPNGSFTATTNNEIDVYFREDSLRWLNKDSVFINDPILIRVTKEVSELELIDS